MLAILLVIEMTAFCALTSIIGRLQYLRGRWIDLTGSRFQIYGAAFFFIIALFMAVRWAVTRQQPISPPMSWVLGGGVAVALTAVGLVLELRRFRAHTRDGHLRTQARPRSR